MARPKVYSINLTDDERSKLNKMIKNKTTCKTALKRCQLLPDHYMRNLDEMKGCGLTHAQIAHTYAVCPATVSNLIRDYDNKGIDSIIRYNISPNSAASLRKADGRAEAKLIQIACAPFQMDIEATGREIPSGAGNSHKQGNHPQSAKKTNSSLTETTTGVSRQRKMPNS